MATTTTARTPENIKPSTEITTNGTAAQDEDLVADVYFLVKDVKHQTEKPYTLYYDPDDGIPRTNVTNERQSITISNFRSIKADAPFQEYGFTALQLSSKLSVEEFYQHERVVEVYYPECKNILEKMFPDASRIYILEHLVCSFLTTYS
jgi:hypothetical protein